MKKLIVILVLMAYGFSSFGMTLHVHFCCGKLDAVKLVPVNDDRCPVDHKEKKQGCCDDKQVELKIKTDYKNESSTSLKLKVPDAAFTHSDYSPELKAFSGVPHSYNKPISPPRDSLLPLYKTNCIYRI